jgi:hypothetical protein
MKRFIFGLLGALTLIIFTSVQVLAVPADISFITANPSDTSIYLKWEKVATYTRISYSTTTYPANYAAGTSAYNDTGIDTNVLSLTAGTTYFFAAWGYDGAYSTNATHIVTTTKAVAIASAGALPTSAPIFTPPTFSAPQAPDTSGFQLSPFTDIIAYFNSAPGGLNMPINNVWEAMTIGFIVCIGGYLFIKTRNFFIAFFVVIFLTWGGAGMKLVQWELLYVEVFVALAAFSLERLVS